MKNTRSVLYALLMGAFVQASSVLAQSTLTNGMAQIPAGSFQIGDAADGEVDAPTGSVFVSAYFMDTNLVTSNLWNQVYLWALTNGYTFDNIVTSLGPAYPVTTVNWYDAVKWCNARSQMAGQVPVYYTNASMTVGQVYKTGDATTTNLFANWGVSGYRLPTEAEWEKGARGGLTGLRFPWGSTVSEAQANYYGDPYNQALNTGYSYDLGPPSGNPVWYTNTGFQVNTLGNTSVAGAFATNGSAANGYGLTDMAGNVFEWCYDYYSNSYAAFPLTDPHGPATGTNRVDRGGDWSHYAFECRTAYRNSTDVPSLADLKHGFRTVLPEVQFPVVTVQANSANEGVVTGGGTFFSLGNSVTNTATPNMGYVFVNWMSNGVTVSSSPTYIFTANTNDNLTANFAIAQYTIGVTPSPFAGGTVSGGATLQVSNNVTVIATPNTGYVFNNWTVGGSQVSISSSYSFQVASNESLVANFTPINYTITTNANPAADGSVTGASGSIPFGTLVTNFASAGPGFQFTDWTVGGNVVSTVTNYAYTVSGNTTLTANFTNINYDLTVIPYPAGYGTVSAGGTYPFNTVITNIATVIGSNAFTSWTINGSQVSTSTNYVLTLTTNELLIGNFSPPGSGSTITLVAYPTTAGTVSGGGTVLIGALVTNTATATNAGYQFAGWTVNDIQVTNANPYIFTVPSSNEVLVANFTNLEYAVESVANPSIDGSVTSVNGAYLTDALVTNTATTNAGYQFVNWTSNGVAVGSANPYVLTANTNVQLIANFTNTLYTVAVVADPNNEGSVPNVSGSFVPGTLLTNTATTNGGFQFVNWTSNGVSVGSANPYVLTVTTNEVLVANFAPVTPPNYTLTVTSSPSNGPAANLSGVFASGSSATVTAATNGGYAFVNWTSNGSIVHTLTNFNFVVGGNETLVANFSNTEATVTTVADPNTEGTVSAGGLFVLGSLVTNTATTNAGFTFVNWTSNGVPAGSANPYIFTAVTNVTVVANFAAVAPPNYTLTVTSSPSNGPAANLSGVFSSGTSATVTAATNGGYAFVNWTSNGSIVHTLTNFNFVVGGNETLVANFSNTEATITTVADPSTEGTVSAGGLFPLGSLVTNTATTNAGYLFVNWTSNGIPAGSANPYIFTAVTNATVIANFAATSNNYNLTVIANPGTEGTVSGTSGSYPAGSLVTNLATAGAGYQFVNWTSNSVPVTTSNSYIVTLIGDATLIANFAPVDYTITVTATPYEGPAASLTGTFPGGSSATFTALTNSGYDFLQWTVNGIIETTQTNYTFTVTSNETVIAGFSTNAPPNQGGGGYTVTVNAYPTNGGSVAGGGTYAAGALVTNTATTNAGFIFIGWSGNATGTNNPLTVTANSNLTITANFATNFATNGGGAGGSNVTLTVLTSGDGSVSPNLNGQVLTAGTTYILTAAPSDFGSVFSGWTGTITTNANPLTLTLSSSMVLQANFTANPLVSMQGTYSGLFMTSNGVTTQTAGMLKLAVSPDGTYSGSLILAGISHSISGAFSGGDATNLISRDPALGGLVTLAMTLTSSNNAPVVTGTVSGTSGGVAWVANLTAYLPTLNPSSGEFTMLMPPDTNNAPPTSSPGGGSYALITNHAGAVTLTGFLADGTAFNESTTVSQDGSIPVFAKLYGNQGLLLGWINLNSINTNGAGLTWIFPGRTTGTYNRGFTNALLASQVLVSPWTNLPASINLLTNLTQLRSINGASVSNTVVTINAAGKVIQGGSVIGAVNPATGEFKVTITGGTAKKPQVVTGRGAVLLNTNLGGGYFLTSTNAQALQLSQ